MSEESIQLIDNTAGEGVSAPDPTSPAVPQESASVEKNIPVEKFNVPEIPQETSPSEAGEEKISTAEPHYQSSQPQGSEINQSRRAGEASTASEPPSPPESSSPSMSRTMVEPSVSSQPTAPDEPKIIDRMREPTEEEKEQIFLTRLKSLSPQGVGVRRAKQLANHKKILTHLHVHGYITNDEVETLCGVKDNTAYKYLAELKRQGLLMQLGTTGRNTRYRLTQAIP